MFSQRMPDLSCTERVNHYSCFSFVFPTFSWSSCTFPSVSAINGNSNTCSWWMLFSHTSPKLLENRFWVAYTRLERSMLKYYYYLSEIEKAITLYACIYIVHLAINVWIYITCSFSEYVHYGIRMFLIKAFEDSKTLEKLVIIFFLYSWNNFWHEKLEKYFKYLPLSLPEIFLLICFFFVFVFVIS